jgi:hypothetical protein
MKNEFESAVRFGLLTGLIAKPREVKTPLPELLRELWRSVPRPKGKGARA